MNIQLRLLALAASTLLLGACATAPKPLHVAHAPRGLLNEKSCGDGAGARVPSLGHSKRSVKRSRRVPGAAPPPQAGVV